MPLPLDRIAQIENRIAQIEALWERKMGTKESSNPDASRLPGDFSAELTRLAGNTTTPEELTGIVGEASAKTGVPEELIGAVIRQESGFNPRAVSPVGAQGLMQLMPGTARSLGVTEPFNARQNVLGGATYLKQQLDRFGTVEKALAAYNAGPGAVQKYGGVPPYRETQQYVQRIVGAYRRQMDQKD